MRNMLIACLLITIVVSSGCGSKRSALHIPENSNPQQQTGMADLAVELTGDEFQPIGTSSETDNDFFRLSIISPKDASRRIAPGEIPDCPCIGEITIAPNENWNVSGLPADESLLLQVAFEPSLDLVTGQPFDSSNKPRLFAIHIPFQSTTEGSATIEATINVTKLQDGAYIADSKASYATNGVTTRTASRLDYNAGQVCYDSDLDGDYADEAWLSDVARISVSPRMLARLSDENATEDAAVEQAVLNGRIESIDEVDGTLVLTDVLKVTAQSRETIPHMEIGFDEQTVFNLRVINEQGELFENSRPKVISDLKPVTVNTRLLTDHETQSSQISWIQSVEDLRLEFPADSIIAVPLKTTAVRGEPVRVTVYANQTAHPLRCINNLRIAMETSNAFEIDSLNAGDRGGYAEFPDGIWALLGAYEVSIGNKQFVFTDDQPDDGRSYLDVQLNPSSGGELYSASGALFNFNLICHEDSVPEVMYQQGTDTVTSYCDNLNSSYTWGNRSNSSSGVDVTGLPMLLEVVDPPATGLGSREQPYLAEAGASYRLRLTHPGDDDVTNHPDTQFRIESLDDAAVTVAGGMLQIADGYVGPIHVSATYGGIHSQLLSDPYLFVDRLDNFALDIHETQTYVFGGQAAAWELELEPTGESMLAHVAVNGAKDLRSVYFEMTFDPELYSLDSIIGTGTFGRDGGFALPAPWPMSQTSMSEGLIYYGYTLVHPQEGPGFTGSSTLATLVFKREKSYTSSDVANALPVLSCADLAWDEDNSLLVWHYSLPGDFNQDGYVSLTNKDGSEYNDWTMLAMYWDADYSFVENSIEDVIDCVNPAENGQGSDGIISYPEMSTFGKYHKNRIDGWRIYQGNSRDQAQLIGEIGFDQQRGDPLTERIWFEWPLEQSAASGNTYFVIPVLNGSEGVASEPVTVP